MEGDAMAERGVLAGRRTIVTGASRGIGRSIALAFAREGGNVALAARNADELERLASEIRDMGRQAVVLPCDVTDPEQVQTMVAGTLEQLGGLDVLVNNAGMAGSHKFVGHPDDLWHRTLALNMTSVYYVTKAAVPAMIEQRWGRVITIASVAGKVGQRYTAAYAASKHGVLGLTKAVALELAPFNITVNAVCPGWVNTPMTDATIANIVARTGMTGEQALASLTGMTPQRRLIEPDEVAEMAVFLARESSKGITGQALNVDGGSVMW
jgi:3-hydroxybutyrate dehydrogenase